MIVLGPQVLDRGTLQPGHPSYRRSVSASHVFACPVQIVQECIPLSERSDLRLVVLQVLVVSLLVTLLGRLWYLQVIAGDIYQQAAASNSVREVITPSVRGLILDDRGRPLVQNRTTLVVTVDRTALGKQEDDGDAVLVRLADLLKTDYRDLADRVALCGQEGAKPGICWYGSPYQPIPVARDVSTKVALKVLERREDFPGVSADLEAVREYPAPAKANAAHMLGYIGPVLDTDVEASTRGNGPELRPSDVIGKAGLEQVYDKWLRGTPGVKRLGVDNAGNVTGTVGETEPIPGNYLVTSIDAKVQAVAERALKERIDAARAGATFEDQQLTADSGAVVVMDVKTGRIVAMASYPSYEPSVWVDGISQKQYDRLTSKKANTPLISRAMGAGFAPASTFKVVSTAAAASAGYSVNASYPCPSEYQVGDVYKQNYESGGFGTISLKRALEVSCNTVFYKLGYETWLRDGGNDPKGNPKEYFVNAARGFGYGSRTGIDLPSETPGAVVSRADKQATFDQLKDDWCRRGKTGYPEEKNPARAAQLKAIAAENCVDGWQYRGGDAVNFAIGQGDTLVTPLQVARVYAAIANGGTLWKPRVAKAVLAPDGSVVKRFKPKENGKLPASPSTIAFLQDALRGVALEGTGAGVFGPGFPIPVAAKTGSGQVYGKDDTSWFASYAPADDPQYAVVMMVSQGGTGSGTSGPGVRSIYEALFGVSGNTVNPNKAILPDGIPPKGLPKIGSDGVVLQPSAPAAPTPSEPTSPSEVSTPATNAAAGLYRRGGLT